jgi:hypothetical protein
MPIYQITNDATGVTLELEGDKDPTQEDINKAFAFAGKQKYPNAPVLEAPPSLYEKAKSVAPAFARIAAPFAFGTPMPQDLATVGRTIQQVTGGEPKQGMLEGASRIDKEGIMALLSASPEKRELGASLGAKAADIARIVTPGLRAVPESVTRPAGEVAGQVAADLLSPMNLMTLGIAGAAGEAARIPRSVAAATESFAEATAPSAARAAQIADLTRAGEAARATEQVGQAIPAVLAPEVTRGAAESTGVALQTIADPEATPEQKLKASYEAAIGTLFAAGLGTQVARSFGMRGKGVTQADVLDNLASRKQTVGEAIGQVSGLIDQMDRIVPVRDLKTQFRELIAEMNPDEPFIYQPEVIGEGPRAQVEGGRLPVEQVIQEAPETLRTQDQILAERLRARDERIAAEEQKALESEAASAGTPLRTAEQAQAQRSAERQALRERAAAIREAIGRRQFSAEELMRGEPTPEFPAEPVRSGEIITPEFTVERPAPREGGMIPPREAEVAPAPEGTALRSTEDILAERLRARDERIAAEQQAAAATSTPLETIDQKLSRALKERNTRLAAEAVAETLESGAAQGEPARVTRKKVEQAIGIGRKEVGLPVAEETIFNEVWNKALEETQGKFRQKAETVAQRLEGLRAEIEPGVGANPFPQLMGAAWNGALSVAQAVIRAGGSVADGVAAGLRYAQQNFKEKFDENEFSNQLSLTIERQSAIQAPPKMEPRAFAERVAAAPGVPPVIREAVAKSPRASYLQQNVDQVVEQASMMTPDQLNADIGNAKSNTRVASGMELFNRYLNEGRTQEAIDLSLKLAESGTTWGQLINQFKLLKSASREGVIQLVAKSMDERGRKLTPEQATKLGDSMDQYRGSVDAVKRAGIKLRDAVNKNDINGIKVNSGLLDMADALKSKSDVALNEQIARLNPSTATDLFISMVQGSVMSPISIIRNVVGNTINLPLRDLADITASGIDMALSGNKNNSYNIRARTLDRIKAFGNSLPQAKKVLLKGSSAMPYELGTDIGNPLNFTRAWGNLFDAMSGKYPDAPVARNLVEATLGAIPDVFLRLSQATDVPFRSADRARIIAEIGRQRGLTEAQIKLATRDPKLMAISDEASAAGQRGFTPDDLGLIEHESAKSVFQQENFGTRMVAGINRFIKEEAGPAGYIPYRLISLFQKTPINVVAETMQFTPAALLQGFNWKNLTPRQRNIAVGRLIVGTMVGGAYAYLYDKGVITPNLDTPGETNKARELAKSGGVMPPGTLNVSGLRRLVRGGDPTFKPGDTVKDLSALGTSGAIGLMVGSAKRLQERSPNDDPDFLSLGKGAALSGINFVMNQQFLKGTSDFIKLMSEESGNSLDRWIKNLAVTAASPVAPAILGVIRRSRREYLPAIGNEGFIKDTTNELNQRFAVLGLQIPGTKDPNAMPVRRDLWGEPVRQTPKSENPWAYNLLSASKSREIDADPLNASIYSTWRRTADNKAIPSVPNPKITYGNKTYERLTPEQYDRYTQLVGFWRRSLAERAYLSGAYQQNGDDARIKLLNQAYDKGAEIGKYRFLKELRESGQNLTPIAARRGFQQPSE